MSNALKEFADPFEPLRIAADNEASRPAPGVFRIEDHFSDYIEATCAKCKEPTDMNEPCCPGAGFLPEGE